MKAIFHFTTSPKKKVIYTQTLLSIVFAGPQWTAESELTKSALTKIISETIASKTVQMTRHVKAISCSTTNSRKKIILTQIPHSLGVVGQLSTSEVEGIEFLVMQSTCNTCENVSAGG